MKNLLKITLISLITLSLSGVYAQEEIQKTQKVKTKSNSANDREAGSGMATGKIHVDSDENGNDRIEIPTSPKPTILVFDSETQAYMVQKVKTKSNHANEKRMHKPYTITKELDASNKGINEAGIKRTPDENGDIDISDLDEGTYKIKAAPEKGKTTLAFTISIKCTLRGGCNIEIKI